MFLMKIIKEKRNGKDLWIVLSDCDMMFIFLNKFIWELLIKYHCFDEKYKHLIFTWKL